MAVFLVFAVRSLGLMPDVIGLCIRLGSIGAITGSITAGPDGSCGRATMLVIARHGTHLGKSSAGTAGGR